MDRSFAILTIAAIMVYGCNRPTNDAETNGDARHVEKSVMHKKHHEVVDIERWIKEFPLQDFERTKGPHKYSDSKPGDPVDLWKAQGEIIVSPADLAVTEQVRRRVGKKHDGKAVPTDIFLFGVGEPKLPYLTKVGGAPYRPTERPWPMDKKGRPLTFFVQFCFLDSKDILPGKLPGDVMLMFIRDWESFYDEDECRIEWSRVPTTNPMTAGQCPAPSIDIPNYYGEIHRTSEYPDSTEIFEREGHDQPWLFATTQATRIGSETWFIQDDPRRKGESLLCTFNCLYMKHSFGSETRFPFINVPSSKHISREQADEMEIILGDCGCIYFLMDGVGNLRWECDCY